MALVRPAAESCAALHPKRPGVGGWGSEHPRRHGGGPCALVPYGFVKGCDNCPPSGGDRPTAPTHRGNNGGADGPKAEGVPTTYLDK